MNERQIKNSLVRHATTPKVSVHEYVDGLVAELGDSIASRNKIYLDTRYWIHLRDAAMGRPTHHCHCEILDHIRFLVSTGAAICPVSDVAWMELSKQTDPQTRLATANLLDELSLGIAIMSEQDRIISEIKQFIIPPETIAPTRNLKDRVWVKAGYILGLTVPSIREWPSEHNLLIQKTSVDVFWGITYREIAEKSGALPSMSDHMERSASKITADMRRYAYQINSIKQAFAAESAGALSVFKDAIGDVMIRHFYNTTGNSSPVPKEQLDEVVKKTLTILANAFRLRPKIMAQHIPSLYAYAMCHAAVRMDKSRKFNGHDLLDIHHASSGIPYHDAVFTENPLRVLVTAGNVTLDKTFACTVLAKESDVLDYLKKLSKSTQPT